MENTEITEAGLFVPEHDKIPAAPEKSPLLVMLHLHYPDLMPEIFGALDAIPAPFDLCLTSSDVQTEKAANALPAPRNLHRFRFILVPNAGRDVAPWLHAIPAAEHLKYDVALKIHGKKSAEADNGDAWRKFLFDSLLGNSNQIQAVLDAFSGDPALGMLLPVYCPDILLHTPHAFRWHKKDLGTWKKILASLGIDAPEPPPRTPLFGAGNMFYYRPRALQKLLRTPPAPETFPPEPLPRVGTLAHALERIPAYVARSEGFSVQRLLPYEALKDTFLRYENALLSDGMEVRLTLSEFFGALGRSIRWRLFGK